MDYVLYGEAGNEIILGTDGSGRTDIYLIGGAGKDTANPDVELFQADPTQPTDHARDVIKVTQRISAPSTMGC